MRGDGSVVLWLAAGGAVALLSPMSFAGKPGGGGTPPADPQIVCKYRCEANSTHYVLCVMNADGTNQRTVFDPGAGWISSADWSPDGTQLVFKSDVQGSGVYVVNLDGTGLRKVAPMNASASAPYMGGEPSWSPVAAADGNAKVAFTDTEPGGDGTTDVYVVNLDGTGRTRLTATPGVSEQTASWSPAADRVAVWTGYETNAVEVHDLDLVGGSLAFTSTTTLTAMASSYPSWEKGGERVAVTASYQVWKVLAGAATQLTATAEHGHPSWSPSGRKLVVNEVSGSARSLVTLNDDGSGLTVIAAGSKSKAYLAPAWRR